MLDLEEILCFRERKCQVCVFVCERERGESEDKQCVW